MFALRPAVDTSPADWILDAARAGNGTTVLRYGPPGFETYLRLPLDPVVQFEAGPVRDVNAMRTALDVLAKNTSTLDVAYVGVWHGYGWGQGVDPVAPKVPLPNSYMFLFTGPVSAMRDAQQFVWSSPGQEPDTGIDTEPDLVWPADRAWCLACDSEEEVEFSIGCSTAAAQALEEALGGLVRRVTYGVNESWERNRL